MDRMTSKINKLRGEYWHKARQLRQSPKLSSEDEAQLILYDEFYNRLSQIVKP